jgi:hypothetical protein
MTPENRSIKEAEAKIKEAKALKNRYDDLIRQYEELKAKMSYKIIKAQQEIKACKAAKYFKRKCMNLCKEHDYLWFDSEEWDNGDRAVIWFGCNHFENCDKDPYKDNHFVHSWGDLYSVLHEYRQLVEKEEVEQI